MSALLMGTPGCIRSFAALSPLLPGRCLILKRHGVGERLAQDHTASVKTQFADSMALTVPFCHKTSNVGSDPPAPPSPPGFQPNH